MATTYDATLRPRTVPQLVFRPQRDRVLVYNAATDQLHALRPLGADILRRCDGVRSAAQIGGESFPNLPPSRREELTARFLADLERRHLIAWRDGDDDERVA